MLTGVGAQIVAGVDPSAMIGSRQAIVVDPFVMVDPRRAIIGQVSGLLRELPLVGDVLLACDLPLQGGLLVHLRALCGRDTVARMRRSSLVVRFTREAGSRHYDQERESDPATLA